MLLFSQKKVFLRIAVAICLLLFPAFSLAGEKREIAFISDTQAPIFVENFFSKSEHNTEATEKLFNDITYRHPQSLFILGDLISIGFMNSSWEVLDRHLAQFRKDNLPVYALPGNHEYIFWANAGISKFKEHFPNDPVTGYFAVTDSIAVFMLNSNFGEMTQKEREIEYNRYAKALDSLNSSSSIRAIIVCCHHSPFTRSSVVSPSQEVQRNFLPLFEKYSKTKLFLSGHSHNLEHFTKNNRDYYVLGGGGGPNQDLYETVAGLPAEIKINNKPRFFYLLISRKGSELTIKVRGVKEASDKIYEFEIGKIK